MAKASMDSHPKPRPPVPGSPTIPDYGSGLGNGRAGGAKNPRVTNGCHQRLQLATFNQCVLPVMTYGAETWTLTVGLVHRFKVAQRAMERAMLGVSLMDRIRNEVICQRTKVTDIAQSSRALATVGRAFLRAAVIAVLSDK